MEPINISLAHLLRKVKNQIAELIADALTGKFGTTNRSELISKLQAIYNDYPFEKKLDTNRLTRVEVIDHSTINPESDKGRVFTHWDDKTKVELSFQDNDRTLKIFIQDRVEQPKLDL